jgi:hypothetical protein
MRGACRRARGRSVDGAPVERLFGRPTRHFPALSCRAWPRRSPRSRSREAPSRDRAELLGLEEDGPDAWLVLVGDHDEAGRGIEPRRRQHRRNRPDLPAGAVRSGSRARARAPIAHERSARTSSRSPGREHVRGDELCHESLAEEEHQRPCRGLPLELAEAPIRHVAEGREKRAARRARTQTGTQSARRCPPWPVRSGGAELRDQERLVLRDLPLRLGLRPRLDADSAPGAPPAVFPNGGTFGTHGQPWRT